ncbi:MAG: hypothetical protein H3C34_24330 [Caldilineaceae bacterium]|nr:hypothetical protein [Caldilineaceae bacterium]
MAKHNELAAAEHEGVAPTAGAFVWPVLPGRSEAWRRFVQEMLGARRCEYEASCQRLGITRELAWLMQLGQGEVAVLYIEARELDRVMHDLAVSDLPFDRWYTQQVRELLGVDLRELSTRAPGELLFAWQGGKTCQLEK